METKPITNADRIRAMTDEELAKFFTVRPVLCEKCFFSEDAVKTQPAFATNAPRTGSAHRRKERGRHRESADSLRGISNRVQGVPGAWA